MPSPIDTWHDLVQRNDPGAIEALLAEDAAFYSPVSHTPQHGRETVAVYLRTALGLLNVPGFRYTGQWISGQSGVLEFEGVVEGVTVNGVDLIWWNEAGLITKFKVMVRPLKAINLLHQHMGQRLAEVFASG